MNTDFRITIGFFSNPKIKKLERRHTDSGIISLIKLWEFTAKYRPKGILYDMDPDDIVSASEWRGDTDFVQSLIEIKLLDQTGQWFKIHDWEKHNHWAMGSEKRSESARKAAAKRWGTRPQKGAQNA